MSVGPGLLVFVIVAASGWVLTRLAGAPSVSGRYASIDGLRGYLAFGVVIYHASIWYGYLHTGNWEPPAAHLYTNLGQGSVALFFMITGFLFSSKLLHARGRTLDWTRLYISRFLRLVPLYLVMVALMVITVFAAMDFRLLQPLPALAKGVATWSLFTFGGVPDLNRFGPTLIIVAGVTWTLPYEWLFYFSLPMLALVAGVRGSRVLPIISAVVVGWLIYRIQPGAVYFVGFIGGIMAAFLGRFSMVQKCSRTTTASVLATLLLGTTAFGFSTAYKIAPLALLSLAFIIIANGNTLFGLLTRPTSYLLGQLTYSVYLLHGVVFFWLFRFVIGFDAAARYSFTQHWALILACVPALVLICFLTFRSIEYPALQSVGRVRAWIGRTKRALPAPIASAGSPRQDAAVSY